MPFFVEILHALDLVQAHLLFDLFVEPLHHLPRWSLLLTADYQILKGDLDIVLLFELGLNAIKDPASVEPVEYNRILNSNHYTKQFKWSILFITTNLLCTISLLL